MEEYSRPRPRPSEQLTKTSMESAVEYVEATGDTFAIWRGAKPVAMVIGWPEWLEIREAARRAGVEVD